MTRLSRILNEAVMGFLALVALATATAPLAFDVSAGAERAFNAVEGTILVVFVLEFAVQFAVAADRRAWLRSPWRLVDAVCIIGPAISFLPRASDTMRGALAFRFLRVGRAVAFGARAGAAAVQERHQAGPLAAVGTPQVTVVTAAAPAMRRSASWSDLLTGAPRAGAWHHAANVSGGRFREVAAAVGITDDDQRRADEAEAGTFVRAHDGNTTLFLWLPAVADEGFPSVQRARLILHVSSSAALTTSVHDFDLPGALALPATTAREFPLAVSRAVLAFLRERYRLVTMRQEEEVRHLEELRVSGRGPVFLGRAFRLQRELSGASADLWRLKRIVQRLADGKLPLGGVTLGEDRLFDALAGELEDLDKEFTRVKEDLRSLLELHMNVTSFEMNKFMKLLAIVGFLGLIPSVTGGLLGMNVAGNPWPVTLGQVAFAVAMAMGVSLYVFAMKGWLR